MQLHTFPGDQSKSCWKEAMLNSTLRNETYFLWAWKDAYVKLFPSYSAKNTLSSRIMWYTSLPEHLPYVFCQCSGDCWPSLKHTQRKQISAPLSRWVVVVNKRHEWAPSLIPVHHTEWHPPATVPRTLSEDTQSCTTLLRCDFGFPQSQNSGFLFQYFGFFTPSLEIPTVNVHEHKKENKTKHLW